jgi:hypothetical protein
MLKKIRFVLFEFAVSFFMSAFLLDLMFDSFSILITIPLIFVFNFFWHFIIRKSPTMITFHICLNGKDHSRLGEKVIFELYYFIDFGASLMLLFIVLFYNPENFKLISEKVTGFEFVNC